MNSNFLLLLLLSILFLVVFTNLVDRTASIGIGSPLLGIHTLDFSPLNPNSPVVHVLVVYVAVGDDVAHHTPVEGALRHVLAPVLTQRAGSLPQVVPGDLGADVVGHVPANVMRQELHPVVQVGTGAGT